jgi:Holliday junction resolvasome RuvABC endonuclease subunit
MICFGWDTGLCLPGLALVETAPTSKFGKVIHAEAFQPKAINTEDKYKSAIDAERISQILIRVWKLVDEYKPDVIVAELPTGGAKSASAIRGMAYSTSSATSIISALRYFKPSYTFQYVPITPLQNKKGSNLDYKRSRGKEDSEQSKWEVLSSVSKIWPDFEFPKKKKNPTELDDAKAWAIADSLSCILTYLRTLQP